MWIVYLVLTFAALYAVVIAGMFFAQTWLLFPTMVAGSARVQLPASAQLLQIQMPDGERLAGVRIPAQGTTAEGASTLLVHRFVETDPMRGIYFSRHGL